MTEATSSFISIGIVVALAVLIVRTKTEVKKDVDDKLKSVDKTYVRRDICHERTDNMQKDISEIKTDVKSLLKMNGKT